jgi:amino acid adenylation domain-containing protein/FkbH-like protein
MVGGFSEEQDLSGIFSMKVEVERVALLFEHGINMIEGTLAALKSSKIYVPFDPTYPEQRLLYMLENSGASLIVTNERNMLLAENLVKQCKHSVKILNIDKINTKKSIQDILLEDNLEDDEDRIAYILYTSGSTGRPKGVVQTHRNVIHFIKSYKEDIKITEEDRLTLFSAFSHDAAVMDIYGGLLSGATLYPLNIREQINIGEVSKWLIDNEITIWHSVPTLYRYFTNYLKGDEEFSKLRLIVLGGESIRGYDVETFKKAFPTSALVNLYGQSESSYNSAQFFNKDSIFEGITLGLPTEETELLIMNDKGKKLGILRAGEIIVKSKYLAKGYWGEKEKTEAVFHKDRESCDIYHTGDLGRRLEDGTIEYMGRKDFQVKIRGFRIEPEEVEGKLLTYDDIKEAVVMARDTEGEDGYLCAYIVAEGEISRTKLREYLARELPEYMIPSYFMQLEEMPLTPNGKINRNELPELKQNLEMAEDYVPPRNETEEKIAALWEKILGIGKVGVRSNFFNLGGHSLKATALVAEIHKSFNVEIPLKEIFTAPTIEEIAKYIDNGKESGYRPIETVEKMDRYPVSAAQKRLFILNQFNEDSTNYNMSFAMEIQGQLEIERLEMAFNVLIERHEALRTFFEIYEGQIWQKVQEQLEFKVGYLDESNLTEEEKRRVLEEFVQPFDLTQAPLLRVKLIKEEQNKHVLMLDMHHIISDGVSMGILVQEFARIYERRVLPKQKLQYKDFAVWQNTEAASEKMKDQEIFWLNQLKDPIEPLNMPLDFKRPEKLTFEGNTIDFEVSPEIVERLDLLAKKNKITMNMLLVAIYTVLIHKYSDQEEIVIGSLVSGRNHIDLENVIGMFSNFLPLVSKVKENQSFVDFLKDMKKVMEEAYSYQEYPFDKIVEKTNRRIDLSRNPIFDTMLIFHNEIDPNMNWEIEGLKFLGRELRNQGTSLDFKMDIYIGNKGQLNGYLQYNKKLYREETMESFIKHFGALIKNVLQNPDKIIREVELFEKEEKKKLIEKQKENIQQQGTEEILTVSATFTAEPIKEYIQWWGKKFGTKVNVEFTGYNQVFQELLNDESLISKSIGKKLLLIRFEDWIRNNTDSDVEKCKKLESNFTECIDILKNNARNNSYFVALFPISTHLDYNDTIMSYLEVLNIRWKKSLDSLGNIQLIDLTSLAERYSIKEVFDPIKDKAGHLPFSDSFYAAIGTKIAEELYSSEELNFENYTGEELLKLPIYNDFEAIISKTLYVAPEKESEKKLVEILLEILPLKNIGIEDDFFALGGDSLKATVLMSKIFKNFQVELSLKDIFEDSKVRKMAEKIDALEKKNYSTIPPIEERDFYPLSSAQKRIFMLQQFEKDSSSYNMPGAVTIQGKIDKEKVSSIFRSLIQRHEALRTSFELIGGEPVQIIHKTVDFTLEYIDRAEYQEVDDIGEFVKSFDLTKAPLLRVMLVKCKEEKHLLIYDMHHIISDGISMNILVKEFVELYEERELVKLPIQYKEYAVWQNDGFGKGAIKKQEKYWLDKFSGEIPVLRLPTDYSRPSLQSFEGDRIDFKIDSICTKKIKDKAVETGTTLYMILLAVCNILLSKYSGGEDIIIGSPIAGRKHDELQNIMGMFVNTLGMRNFPIGDKSFRQFLEEVKENAMEAYENQEYPFEELVNKLDLERDISRNALFDVMFSMQNMNVASKSIEGLKFIPKLLKNNIAKFDLTISAEEIDGSIAISIEYCTKLFRRETIEKIGEHFTNILMESTKALDIKIAEIDMLSSEEKQGILQFSGSKMEGDNKEKKLHQLFEEQVEKTPDKLAMVIEEKEYTYAEVNKKANQLARKLRETGITANVIVGILAERSVETIIAILGILKAGGAYLPIDPEYPEERITYVLEDSGVGIVLTDPKFKEKISFKGKIINLQDTTLYKGKDENLENVNTDKDLAYIIYTSGSTGEPKGVLIEHRNIVNQIIGLKSICKFDGSLRYALLYKLTFDVSVQQIFVCLTSGAKLFVPSEEIRNNMNQFWQFIDKNGINIIDTVPSFAEAMIESRDVKQNLQFEYFIIGADTFSKNLYDRLKDAFSIKQIINAYGPTETTINATLYPCKETELDKTVPIGRPLPNYTIYILDKYNNLVPVGIPGELCIGGKGVGRGYLNKSELTTEKFIPNPFIEGERIYKTGDLAKWLPSGNIEFLGRIDNQVKIRGFRIELGEIESQILRHNAVKEAIVIDRKDEIGNKYLCGYFIGDKDITAPILKDDLMKVLPDYMIPTYLIKLEKMPLTSNGKINRKALPKPEEDLERNIKYVAPENELEEKLSRIFNEVLNKEKIGRMDNFFELGGHSLKAILLGAKIHKVFNVEVPLKEIFKTPTVGKLATYIQNKKLEEYSSIEVVGERQYYPVSSAEKRLFTLNQFEKESIGYNMPGAIRMKGQLDRYKLEKAFNSLIKRHSTLRTSFEVLEDEVVQIIHEDVEFSIEYMEVKEDKVSIIAKNFIRPFDLSVAPLLRVKLLCTSENQYVLLFDMHHIISDGVSMEILIKEFAQFYGLKELPPLKIQYKDYSVWQQQLIKDNTMSDHEKYWIDKFSGEIPILNLPTDYIRPSMQQFEGDRVTFKLNKESLERLKDIAVTCQATTYIVLLAAYNVLLAKYSGQEDIIVGTPIAGRNHADLQDVIGMFVNTLAMRNFPEGDKTFFEFLEDVKRNSIEAYEHEQYQFEELVEKLEIRRDISRNPIFDTVFVMQSGEEEKIEVEGITFSPYELEKRISKFDLTLSAMEAQDGLYMDIEYSTKLFKRETIERMKEHFIKLIEEIIEDKDKKISVINLLLEEEERKLISLLDNREVEYPKKKTIQKLFEEQAERVPDQIALICGEKSITYRELNERANQLAYRLREKGVKADSIVGIQIDRSIEIIIGMIGTLKAGGAYLPMDPTYPKDRIQYMMEDSKINIVLTMHSVNNDVVFEGEKVYLDEEESYSINKKNPVSINTTEDLAYIIYTSGSTGKPKGAMIEHKNVVRLMKNEKMLFDFTEADTWTMFHSMCFDFSVWEIYGALLYGGKLVIVKKEVAQNTKEFLQLLKKEKVTVLNQTPTAFYNLCNEEEKVLEKELSLRYIVFGGEALKPGMLKAWREKYPNTELINMYGITETTVHVTFKKIREEEIEKNISNIGKPIPTLSMYIMDKNMKLQPLGVPGEICVGGDGVGRGYLNRAELTKEKFVQNPYVKGERLYRSGDLARVLSNGELEYLGRIDQQVKIRGFRIELGEIETQLLRLKDIKDVVVLHKEEASGEGYLCGYIVSERELSVAELRAHLSLKLPDYMIPAYFVQLEKIPLTSNGKVDRKMLPEPKEGIVSNKAYVAPKNKMEEKLATLWQEALGLERVGMKDNFFELGGHSLKAANLVAKIHQSFNVEVPLKEIFKAPTMEGLADYIRYAKESQYLSIQKADKQEWYPVSSAQKRLFALHQSNIDSTSYNMSFGMQIKGKLDKERIESTFKKLIERHEALRTSFEMKEGEVIQKVKEKIDFEVEYVDILTLIEKDIKEENEVAKLFEEKVQKISADFVQPFDLSKTPLLRVKLVKEEDESYKLMVDLHHIISDGVSMGILMQEFVELYEGKELPELKLQYKDFAVWQNSSLVSKKLTEQEEYWTEAFKKVIEPLNMPLDFERPENLTFEGRNLSFEVSSETVEALNNLAKEKRSTLNMVLLSMYSILLNKYSDQEEIVMGSLVAGRRHMDLDRIMGMFANFLPIKANIDKNQSFEEFLEEMNYNITEVYDNQEYPFEKIVEKVNAIRDRSRNPIFDTMMIFHNEIDNNLNWEIEGLKFTSYSLKNETVPLDFKVDFYMSEKGELKGYLQYNINLYKEETMKRFIQHFNSLMNTFLKNPKQRIAEIELFEKEEKAQLEKRQKKTVKGTEETISLAVSATFTSEPIKEYVQWWGRQFGQQIQVEFAAYNQVFQELLTPTSLLSTNKGLNLLLVRMEDWIRDDKNNDVEKCKKLERTFTEFIEVLKNKNREIPYFVGIFPLSTHLKHSEVVLNYLEVLNVRWREALKEQENIHLIDFTDLGNNYSIQEIFDPVKDKAGHLPFSDSYYAAMGTDIARKIYSWKKQPFKVIVVDCDNTLWKGVCGEDGTLGVKVDEPYKNLQKLLLQKNREGMLLAICSKNNEEDVWEVFEKNPGMILKKEHFIDWRINWKAKSENIKEMATALNLGADSFIFIDDSPMECAEVMTNCPQVLTLQLPKEAKQITRYLRHVWALDRFKVTKEDRNRTQMYMQERKRQLASETGLSLSGFLEGLKLKMSMKLLEKDQYSRVAQLTQRTNQFNLSTIRRTEIELETLIAEENMICWVVEVADRFGEYGLVGVVITKEEAKTLYIDTLLLSCRVLARGIENAIMTGLKRYCLEKDLTTIKARYYPTAKNKPILEFFEKTKWNKKKEQDKNYKEFKLSIEEIPDSIEYIDFYYKQGYVKVEQEEIEKEKIGEQQQVIESENIEKIVRVGKIASEYVAAAVESKDYEESYDWDIELVNEEKLLYKNHLLPLKYYTGRALLEIPVHDLQEEKIERAVYVAPIGLIEEKMVKIWYEILGVENIGIVDDFFKIGGDSLKAIIMVSKVHKEFNIELPLKEVFENPTIRHIAACISKMQFSGKLKDNSVEQALILLNEKKEKNIFLFPPIIGYGISYKYLSNLIKDSSVYALNFIEGKDAMDHYVRLLCSVQKEGPYMLLGYSAGGNVAFEVAKELEKRGYEVSDVILFDSYKKDRKGNLKKEDIQMSVDNMINALKADGAFAKNLNSEVVIENIADKVEGYEGYINELVIEGTIKADIHFIKAGDNYLIPGIEDTREGWRKNTTGEFLIYEGFGNHFEMINPGYGEENQKILRKIYSRLK